MHPTSRFSEPLLYDKKLYSFEDQDFKLSDHQESLNFGQIKEENNMINNVPSPIQNNTMQELDSEFLKEYEDAISDRDKKIAELMLLIEKMKREEQENPILRSPPEEIIREIRQKTRTSFELATKLMKDIEKMQNCVSESPKFSAGEKNYEKFEVIGVLKESLGSLEQELGQFFDLLYKNMQTNEQEPNFAKKNNLEMESSVIEGLRRENIEIKYELQNSIQQIQELEIENIGLNDQIATLSKQLEQMKGMQNKISEKEEILLEKSEKLEKELKEQEEKHKIEIGKIKEDYNFIIERKQNEIADLNKNKQVISQLEAKIRDLMKEVNSKNNGIGNLTLKKQELIYKIHAFKRNFRRVHVEKIKTLKAELLFLKKSVNEHKNQSVECLKYNLSLVGLKFSEEKRKLQYEHEISLKTQVEQYESKLKKSKTRIKNLKKELKIANEFKYQAPPPEETINLIHSKLISEIEERKSFYPKDFMKDTSK